MSRTGRQSQHDLQSTGTWLPESEASAWEKEPLPNFKSSLKVTDKHTDCAEVSRAAEGVLLGHGSSSAAEKSPGWWLLPGLAVAAGEAEGKEEGVVGV